MKQIQLAHLYKNGGFYGYGIAVDGQLLSNQVAVNIETRTNQPAIIIHVDYNLSTEAVNNSIDIELSNKKEFNNYQD